MTATTKSTTEAKEHMQKHANKKTDKQRIQYEDKHARMALTRHGIFSLSQVTHLFFFFSTESSPFLKNIQQLRNLIPNEAQVA